MSAGHEPKHEAHKADSHWHGGGGWHDAHDDHGGGHGEHGNGHDDHGSGHGGHGWGHDAHKADPHWHGGGGWHDDHGGGHGEHDKERKLDHWGHEIHDEDHGNDEPIESAGIVNDLRFDLEPTVDLTSFFVFSGVMTVEHSRWPVFSDLSRAGETQKIDLSRPLVMKIDIGELRPAICDLYPGNRYEPKWYHFGEIKFQPRFDPVRLCDPLPPIRENTVDIRALPVIPSIRLYPDLYRMPETFGRIARRIRRRHGARILKTAVSIAATGMLLASTLATLTYFAKNEIVEGYLELSQLNPGMDANRIETRIHTIRQRFSRASKLFLPMRYLISMGIGNETVRNGYHALYAGTAVSQLLSDVDELRAEFVAATPWKDPAWYFDPDILLRSKVPVTDFFKSHRRAFADVMENLSRAQFHFSSITTTGNPQRDEQLAKIASTLKSLDSMAKYAFSHEEEILKILGDKKPMNYLIINQNRDELRANGGFPGSAVEITLYKGKLEKYEKKDIYYYDWHLFPYGETPPPGISQIAKTWGMRDANYYPDIRQSFETISRMYEKAGGSTLDGLVAINQGLVQDLLTVTWPIRILWVPDEIDSSSFSLLMSVLVEGEYGRKNTAKDVLFLAIDAIQKKISKDTRYAEYFKVVQKNIADGQILVAARDDDANAFAEEIFGKPKYRDNPDNFVYPLFTSLSGNKSDRYVKRTFNLSHLSQSGCTSTNRVEIVSEHAFSDIEREHIRNMLFQYGVSIKEHEHELFVQGNGDNVQFVRLLIPKHSTFVGISKEYEWTFEMNAKNPDYDEISFTVTTGVKKTSRMFVDYASTPESCKPDLEFIRQPGLQNFQVNTK